MRWWPALLAIASGCGSVSAPADGGVRGRAGLFAGDGCIEIADAPELRRRRR